MVRYGTVTGTVRIKCYVLFTYGNGLSIRTAVLFIGNIWSDVISPKFFWLSEILSHYSSYRYRTYVHTFICLKTLNPLVVRHYYCTVPVRYRGYLFSFRIFFYLLSLSLAKIFRCWKFENYFESLIVRCGTVISGNTVSKQSLFFIDIFLINTKVYVRLYKK